MLTWLLIGVGLLLAAAAVRAERRRRDLFAEQANAFVCRARARGPTPANWRGLRRHWSRPMWAVWKEDVLQIRRGPILARTVRLAAVVAPAGVRVLSTARARGDAARGVAVQLWGEEGWAVELVTPEQARTDLVGPYLAAAIRDLPKAPVPRRNV